MLSISSQVEKGKLVCPRTHERLKFADNSLVTEDGKHVYEIANGVPILLSGRTRQTDYLAEHGGAMEQEYKEGSRKSCLEGLFARAATEWFKNPDSRRAFREAIGWHPEDELCISVGGGPMRAHPNLVNVNIDLFPGVDVVADAYEMPYADESVAGIACLAVLEHLEYPSLAVKEMFRVLRKGGLLYAETPFLTAFHAYPSHFQNFTVTGHERLFERVGFRKVSSGTAFGPNFAMCELAAYYMQQFIPMPRLATIVSKLISFGTIPIKALDLIVNKYKRSQYLAYSTWVHMERPVE